MRLRLGSSSERYRIALADVLVLPDRSLPDDLMQRFANDEVVLCIGLTPPQGQADQDVLLKGRAHLLEAHRREAGRVLVRVAFVDRTAPWDILASLIKKHRKRKARSSACTYHMSSWDIRRMGIERGVRDARNAYRMRNARLRLTDGACGDKFAALVTSMRRHGYREDQPMIIMLRRSFGVLDTLDQGHHRMAASLEAGIEQVAVRFSAARQPGRWLIYLLMPWARRRLQNMGF